MSPRTKHLVRGCIGIVSGIAALPLMRIMPWLAVALIAAALIAFRG